MPPSAFEAAVKIQLQAIEDVVGRIDHTINGNGAVGLKTDVYMLKQDYRRNRWYWRAIVGAILLIGGERVASHVSNASHECPNCEISH